MQFKQIVDQRIPVSGPDRGGPAFDRFLAMQWREMGKPRRERGMILQEVPVLLLQEVDAERLRLLDANTIGSAHRSKQRIGKLHSADSLAFGFHVNRPRGIEALQR